MLILLSDGFSVLTSAPDVWNLPVFLPLLTAQVCPLHWHNLRIELCFNLLGSVLTVCVFITVEVP